MTKEQENKLDKLLERVDALAEYMEPLWNQHRDFENRMEAFGRCMDAFEKRWKEDREDLRATIQMLSQFAISHEVRLNKLGGQS